MAETLSLISNIAFVAAGICLIVAIIVFIRFKIPVVIGDLSGRNARKSIEQMRIFNEKSGNKSYKSSENNLKRGKITETMQEIAGISRNDNKHNERPETGLLEENAIYLQKEEETDLLVNEEVTGILEDENSTQLLDDDIKKFFTRKGGITIQILEEVMLVHTNEVI